MKRNLLLTLAFFAVAAPVRPSIMTTAGYCWQSDGNPNLNQLIAYVGKQQHDEFSYRVHQQ